MAGDPDASGLGEVLRLVHGRYGLPVMVTETSAPGTHLERARWMADTLAEVRLVRARRACRSSATPGSPCSR